MQLTLFGIQRAYVWCLHIPVKEAALLPCSKLSESAPPSGPMTVDAVA